MHLNDEQFETILSGPPQVAAQVQQHLDGCPQCRRRLADDQALRSRLRQASQSIQAPQALRQWVHAALDQAPSASIPSASAGARRTLRWRLVPILAAAAAVLLIAIPGVLNLLEPGSAYAAESQLEQIHEMNLSNHHGFYSQDDPVKLAEYFRSKLGFTPRMPQLGQGLALRGCCTAHFKGRIAGTYVVETPSGPISIIVVSDPPQSLGRTTRLDRNGRSYWASSYGHCNMASTRLGDYTYCAVGMNHVSHEQMVQLLEQLVK